ncbi:MAG: hypothetical protein AAF546_00875 [Verrucomicrobiota bacterium]
MQTKADSNTRPQFNRERPILLGFALQKKGPDGRLIVSFRWFRIFAGIFTFAIAAYLAGATALYFHFKYRKDYEAVRFQSMLTLPFRLSEHRKEMGDYQVQRGLEAAEEGDYRSSLNYLRQGVARSPGNLEGRSILAEFYELALKRSDVAADLMVKGLHLGGIEDIEYLKKTLRLLLRYQMDEEIQKIADEYLPETPDDLNINKMLAFGAANANFLRGNFDQADDYILSYNLVDSLEGLILSSEISWDRGNEFAAITKLEQSLEKFPNSEPLLMQLSRFHRELNEIDQARRYAILRNVSDPLSPAPRIELLYIYNKSEDFEREKVETQRLLRQFREDREALQALANFGADTGNVELARRTYEEALENEFAIDPFALLLIEAHLVSRDYLGALSFAEELLKERPDWLNQRWAIFNSLRAVASYGTNRPDLGEIYLQDFLDGQNNPSQTFLAVARRFVKIDRQQQAKKVLTIANQRFPENQKILSELIRVELALGSTDNLNRLLTKLLQMRRPEMELLESAYQKLGSDRFIFTRDRESLLIQLSAILRENNRSLTAI